MRIIDCYVVKGLLGRGGMGQVFKVQIPVIEKAVALKILAPAGPLVEILGMAALEKRFIGEAVTMARICHPHVAEVIGFGRHEGRPYYLQEYYGNHLGLVLGETHRPEEPSRRLPLPRAARYAGQLLEGLARLHHDGIVHRDIKPHNLLLNPEDRIRIGDFGLSKVRGERFAVPASLRVGSPGYAAPEQERDPEAVTPAADLYAAGVVLYRMLTGVLPEDSRQPLNRLNPDLDNAWKAFFGKALDPEPRRRFASAEAMRETLERLEAAWQARLADTCRLAPFPQPPPDAARTAIPRRVPLKTGHRHNRAQLGLDRLWRPAAWSSGTLRRLDAQVVEDPRSGLLWQYRGSPYPLAWHAARDYVAGLNHRGLAGRTDWRLPTIPELSTLLRPPPSGSDHCLEPVFHPEPQHLWSCDRRAFTTAWYVSLDLGYVAWQDMGCSQHVKAVAGGSPEP
jgi:serine/threonine-protein kinase